MEAWGEAEQSSSTRWWQWVAGITPLQTMSGRLFGRMLCECRGCLCVEFEHLVSRAGTGKVGADCGVWVQGGTVQAVA